ncbi:non-ribosomal peptide synthetase module [Achlya hypogyna]|uniref:Non-ribosomal peptide synthetase module n=1 Tax=Achlya hypogyna TaxID=1202772 RepID=A0A1V9ZHP9_ACHHY|nr:non-ribosomal peptide synthetase module [Achlya hypogyna]
MPSPDLADDRVLMRSEHALSAPIATHTLPELFEHTARAHPDRVALSIASAVDSDAVVSVTYADVVLRVRRMAHVLAPLRQASPFVIGVWLDKSLELTLAILATTFAGATWLPFDPDAPVERVAICVQNAAASVLLVDARHAALLTPKDIPAATRVVDYSDVEKASTVAPTTSVAVPPTPETPAYYIYTSGTTGTPKGIAISHRAATLFAYSESSVLGLRHTDIVWNGFSPAFDMWVEETWCGFARGCELAVALPGQWKDIARLVQVWTDRRVSVITAVPTLMAMVCNESTLPPHVRLVNVGGEACPASLVTKLARPGLQIFNTYGPTETTVTCTYTTLAPHQVVTIGKPLPGYHAALFAVADDDAKPTPLELLELVEGATGELAIGGPCVGLGYVGLPELTAEKFVPHPRCPHERLYRTGDLVTIDAAGDIVFLGRIDTQVKYRGFRIELGEIEDKLSGLDGVVAAAVILTKEEPQRLEAYVVLNKPFDAPVLRAALAQTSLMAYMLPDVFVPLVAAEMPRLLSGKIDKKQLQVLSASRRAAERSADASNAAFHSSLDFVLFVCRKLFADAEVAADDDLFTDLGAHSMLVAQIVSELRQGHANLEVNPFATIGLVDLYTLRTARTIADKYPLACAVAEAVSDRPAFRVVPWARHFLCGLAQLPLLFVLFFLYFVTILMPFIVSDYYYQTTSSFALSMLSLWAAYASAPIVVMVVAVAAKWLLLGRVKAGAYPVWGFFYLRWWFVGRLLKLVDLNLLGDTYWLVLWYRALGAHIGNHVHLDVLNLVACDLLYIGDHATLGKQVLLSAEYVDNGVLHLGPIRIGARSAVGTSVTLEANVLIEDDAEIESMSGVVQGSVVPARQVFGGSPATFVAPAAPWTPTDVPSPLRARVVRAVHLACFVVVLPAMNALPLAPVLYLFNVPIFPEQTPVAAQLLGLAAIVGVGYVLTVTTLLVATKWLLLGKVQAGTYAAYSSFGVRKWFVDGLMALSLDTIHTLYATVYSGSLLRLLGATVGARSEISTARHMTPDLVFIGHECFVADNVLLGDEEARGYSFTLAPTVVSDRAFVGNDSLVPQGAVLPPDSLVGAFSVPLPALASGQSCFGLPPLLMPARTATTDFDVGLLYSPSLWLRTCRVIVETLRVWFPPALVCLGIGTSTQLLMEAYPLFVTDDGDLPAFLNQKGKLVGAEELPVMRNFVALLTMAPLYYVGCMVVPGLTLLLLLKWTIVGRYSPVLLPMYCFGVWSTEFITGVLEHLSAFILVPFVGTPFLPWIYIAFGAKIGARCFMGSVDIPEFDMLDVGDDVAINESSFPQTHLFEDRVMKIGRTTLGDRSTMRMFSTLFPDSEIGRDMTLECNSVVMKGEKLRGGTTWQGFPVQIAPPSPSLVTILVDTDCHPASCKAEDPLLDQVEDSIP